tara:strand:+ start:488 stop:733 length:246 start_codon:yes stop_codon:yes gene_type:complete
MIIQEFFQCLMDFIHWYVTDAAQVLTFRIGAALFAARIIFDTRCWVGPGGVQLTAEGLPKIPRVGIPAAIAKCLKPLSFPR